MSEFTKQRFLTHAQSLNEVLAKGRNQKEKGKSFFKHKGRDVLFRLEALCRIYREGKESRLFAPWYKEFKSLEDLLGSMDHHLSMHTFFSAHKELSASSEKIFLKRFEEEAAFLSDLLLNGQWLSGRKMSEFTGMIEETSFGDEEADRHFYGSAMIAELEKLLRKYGNGEIDPYKLEAGMHEFRRRIRWVSIYATASNGLIQLRNGKIVPAGFEAFCTQEIAASPFNIMPAAARKQMTIQIRSSWFYALSWLIAHLSELKDTGLTHASYRMIRNEAGVKNRELDKRILASLKYDPLTVYERAEDAIDNWIMNLQVADRISRDIRRSLQ